MASGDDVVDRLKAALAERYHIESEIGSGGMATVYLAEDLKHDRQVAVKVLRPELAASLGPERFLAEIRVTARLQHPHIVPLFDSGEAGGCLYYVMPYIDGESLRARLEREGRLEVDAMLSIARPVAQALADAHEAGVVHRDIKPENILLSRDQPFVTDFGIARAVSLAGGERLTATGVAVGTPAYMSPEQVLGEGPVDARSDVYSLGCVIYEMLSGSPPFSGSTVHALMVKRLTGPPPHLTNVPGPVDEVVRRSLATSPHDRFGTALALADALVEAARRPAAAELSIVVLPFDNLSPDPEQEYFADGLTEEVISDLSTVRALRVIARTSAMTFKGSRKRAAEIADELNVRYVLEGSVRRAGSSLRIAAQLIDAATDAHLWAGKYPGTLEDVFDIQEKVSRAIVEALKVALDPAEDRRLSERPIDDVRAHECVLRARREIWQFTEDSTARALGLLREALRIVGDNAHLYEGMAQAHIVRAHTGVDNPGEELLKMAACAEKALALNPASSFAHTCAGIMAWKEIGRQLEGVRRLKHAFDLNPNDVNTAFWLNCCAGEAGKLELAHPAVAKLLEIDPLSVEAQLGAGMTHWMNGEFAHALTYYERAYQLDPNSAVVRHYNVHGLMCGTRFDEACQMAETMERDFPEASFTWFSRLFKHGLRGEKAEALESVTRKVEETARFDETYSYFLAEGFALIDEKATALEWLENAVSRGFLNYPYLAKHAPFFGNLRSERRFKELMVEVEAEWESFEV